MSSWLQLLNDKLLNNLPNFTGSPSHTSTDQPSPATVIYPCSVRPIPFTVPVSSLQGSSRRTQYGNGSVERDGSGESMEASSASGESGGSLNQPIADHNVTVNNLYRGLRSLGSIDPRLYKMAEEDDYDIPDNHIGRIWFAVEYERQSEKLLLTLIKARNILSRLSGTTGCDHFVRIFLLPDERRYLQSKFKKKACNPQFDESFVFQVSNRCLDERVVKVTVYEVDRHKRHVIIGHALYPLRDHNYEGSGRVVIWRDLEREISETTLENGELLVSLCYKNHQERLTVAIFEGKNFKKVDEYLLPDIYIKVCLLQQSKVVKTKKTEVVKRSVSPAFNESFTFKVPVAGLDATSISITAIQNNSSHKDRVLGRIVLGSFMFSRGKELEHWNKMTANPTEQFIHWHSLT